MMLRDYIEPIVERITADKRDRCIYPASCTLVEITKVFEEDAKAVMRAMHREDPRYEAHKTVNQVPMLILTDQNTQDNE